MLKLAVEEDLQCPFMIITIIATYLPSVFT